MWQCLSPDFPDLQRKLVHHWYDDFFLSGLFLAPTVTAGALKVHICANIYERLGFAVIPNGTESRHDIIQAVTFGTPEGVVAFCKGIQAAAPVDSFVTPNRGICRAMTVRSLWRPELCVRFFD